MQRDMGAGRQTPIKKAAQSKWSVPAEYLNFTLALRSSVLLRRCFAQLYTALNPWLVPIPNARNVHSVSLRRVFCVFRFPHLYVLTLDAEFLETGFLDLPHYI